MIGVSLLQYMPVVLLLFVKNTFFTEHLRLTVLLKTNWEEPPSPQPNLRKLLEKKEDIWCYTRKI